MRADIHRLPRRSGHQPQQRLEQASSVSSGSICSIKSETRSTCSDECAGGGDGCTGSSIGSESEVPRGERHSDDDNASMTGRQRRIYETAFDSSVKADSRDEGLDLEELVSQHPILTQNDYTLTGGGGGGGGYSGPTSRNPTPRTTPKSTPGGTPKSVGRRPVAALRSSREGASRGTSKERRLGRDSLMGGGSGPALLGSSGVPADERLTGGARQEVQAVVHHCPPRSANSTPTLSYRAKEGFDSRASSAKSTPTHLVGRDHGGRHHLLHHLPLRQLSELTLGENRNTALNKSTASMPPDGSSSSASGSHRSSVEMDCRSGRLPCDGAVSSEESVASTSSSSSSSNNNSGRGSRGSVDNHRQLKLASRALSSEQSTTTSTPYGPKISTFHLSQLRTNTPLQLSTSQQQQQQQPSSNPAITSEQGVGADDDGRPNDEYDPPWEFGKNKSTANFILNLSSAAKVSPVPQSSLQQPMVKAPTLSSAVQSADDATTIAADERSPPAAFVPPSTRQCRGGFTFGDIMPKCEQPPTSKPEDGGNQSWSSNDTAPKPNRPNFLFASSTDSTGPSRNGLALNFNSQSPKRKRRNLQLNFGCAALSVLGEPVDETIPLDRQEWYHGAISRIDAESLLRVLQEGSYLVRNSESSKQDYSLSLKSARGFMHMKIVFADGKYILGQFSKPFTSIPEMIHHYSINKLPIKGAEHMSLLHPVIDQLL